MSQISKHNQPFIIDALSTDGTSPKPGQELIDRTDADQKIIAHSLASSLSGDANFAQQLQIGDIVISMEAAANQVHSVIANKTLPAGFSGTNLLAVALRAAAKPSN